MTACFKLPVREYIMEAWSVLIKACRPNAFLPTVVDENYRKAIAVMGRLDELATSASNGHVTPHQGSAAAELPATGGGAFEQQDAEAATGATANRAPLGGSKGGSREGCLRGHGKGIRRGGSLSGS